MTRLRTDAWLLRGTSSLPGELRLHAGILTFTSKGTGSTWPFQLRKLGSLLSQPNLAKAVEAGTPFQFFAWPAREVQTATPWYYFGGGIKLRFQSTELRFSFGRPASNSHNLAAAASELKEVSAMRKRGKLWANALANASAQNTGEA
jgi:hypothetical protein